MRFDLTVNEFTRELWADRELEVFGEQFWRPYIHVRDAAARCARCSTRPREQVAGEVFNAGRSGENYRKLDLVEEIGRQTDRGKVSYVHRDEDPRDYKVSFDKIRARARLRDADDGPRRDRARSSPALDAERVRRPVRRALQEHPLSRAAEQREPVANESSRICRCSTCACSRRTSTRSPRRCARAG